MGIITITLDDEVEEELRKLLREKFGKEKGELSRFIGIAVKNYIQELKKGGNYILHSKAKKELLKQIALKNSLEC